MEKEFNLSERRLNPSTDNEETNNCYLEEDVKEFIKRLKKKFESNLTVISKRKFLNEIDKLVGEKLK